MNNTLRLALGAGLLLAANAVAAAPVQAPHIEAELVSERAVLAPGENWLALRLKPEQGWHTYWRNPGDSGLPTQLSWTLPQGFAAGEIQWPYPHTQRLGDLVNYGYGEETLHLALLTVPPDAVGQTATLQAEARWLVCAEICIPGKAPLTLSLPVAAQAQAHPDWAAVFAQTRKHLPQSQAAVQAVFQIADDELRLKVVGLEPGARAQFFAYANDLVNHSSPVYQALDAAQGEYRYRQALSGYFTRAPEHVAGVVVLGAADAPARAVEISALPGVVESFAGAVAAAAEPAPAAPPGLARVLLFALIGGLILNLMPCVFPVLSIKAVSLLEAQNGERQRHKGHALAYTGGVVLACMTAALAILGLRAGGEVLGWGFQLQSPRFIAALGYLFFVLALGMSGFLQIGSALMGVGQSLTVRHGYAGSFFTGVLAVLVASPCTAPYMGTALGYALTQPAASALLVFAVLGLGLALPFLLLGFFPRLGAWLPKPGAWMETFKQFMAFPLYLTVVWLLWVLGRQTSADGVAVVLAGLVLLAFAVWLLDHAGRLSRVLRYVAVVVAAGLLLHPLLQVVEAKPHATAQTEGWEPYSAARLQQLREQGRAVFINFTADWCISCKVNERVALETGAVRKAFAQRNVALLKGDWTREDPQIGQVLERFGRPGVPLYLLYPPSGEPQVLPQILTPDLVIEAVDRLPQQG